MQLAIVLFHRIFESFFFLSIFYMNISVLNSCFNLNSANLSYNNSIFIIIAVKFKDFI